MELTPDTKIRLSQIKWYTQDKHSRSLKAIPEGSVRRWKDGKLHQKTSHGWITIPESKEYDVKTNIGAQKKNKGHPIPGRQTTQKEFEAFIDSLYKDAHIKEPKTIKMPQLRRGLMKQIGLDTTDTFLFSTKYFHVSPERKTKENQVLTEEEYKQIPQVIKSAKHAILEKGTGDFKIIFEDKNNPKKYNKIVFSKINKGNYMVTLGKVDKENVYNRKKDKIVGEGVAPSI